MLDSYTLKKVVPRLVIAVIAVNLSWWICIALLEFSNIIGSGTQDLLLAPFGGIDSSIIGTQSFGQQTATTGTILGIGVGVTLFSSWAIFLPILVAGLLALVAGYFTLILRQVLIIITILLSPVAIALWVIPGTEGYAKKWWSLFMKLLLMYPIIIALLMSGRIVSRVAGTEDAFVTDIIAIIAIFAPYFMIPFVLKFLGGIIATIGGFANDRSKGMVDGLRKRGAQKSAENRANFLAGSRFGDTNRLTKGLNTFGAHTGAGITNRFGYGLRGRQKIDQALRGRAHETSQTAAFNAVKDDDGFTLQAMTYANADEAREGLRRDFGVTDNAAIERSVAAVRAGPGFSRANQVAASQQLVVTGTGFNDVVDDDGNVAISAQQQMAQTFARASGGSEETATALAGFANATTKKVGRGDLAPGFNNLRNLTLGEMGSTAPTANSSAQAYDDAAIAAARGQDNITLLRDKTPGFRRTAGAMERGLTRHMARAQDVSLTHEQRRESLEEAKRISGQIHQFDASRDYASDENQQAVHELSVGTETARNQLDAFLATQPNAEEHLRDMDRYRGARSVVGMGEPDDPRIARPPAGDDDA